MSKSNVFRETILPNPFLHSRLQNAVSKVGTELLSPINPDLEPFLGLKVLKLLFRNDSPSAVGMHPTVRNVSWASFPKKDRISG